AEHHGRGLEDASAVRARRVLLAGIDPLQHLLGGPGGLAAEAHDPPDVPVDLGDHRLGKPGDEMEPVDVLGDAAGETARPVEVDDRKSTRLNSSHAKISY